MYRLIISHETRAMARTGALWSILGLLVAAILFAAWAGGRSIDRQVKGATDAQTFEEADRARMRQ